MQALKAELFGFAEKFRCFCSEEFKDSLFPSLISKQPAISPSLQIWRYFCGLVSLRDVPLFAPGSE